jgi:hypothetical protein
MRSTEAAGLWWLPNLPATKVPGILKVDEGGRSRLELIGCFRDAFDTAETPSTNKKDNVKVATSISMETTGNYGRICGQVGSKEYTLDDCFRIHWSSGMFGSAIAREEIRVGRYYEGIWLDAKESAEFIQADVHLQWLPFWLMESAIAEQWLFEERGTNTRVRGTQVKVSPLATRSCRPWAGWTVSLHHRVALTGNRVTGRSVSQEYFFSVSTTTKTPIAQLLDVAADLQTLLSFGLNRPIGFDGIQLRHPEAHPPGRPQRAYLNAIDLVLPWSFRDLSEREPVSDYDMAFTFPQLGGMKGVRNFLRVAETYRPSLTRVIASRMAREMFVSDQLLHRAAALEAFDRERTNAKKKIDFKDRLVRSVAYAGQPFSALVADVPAWATRVTRERNDAAHTLGLGSDASDQYFIARSLYWLYLICLLREAQMPKKVLDHIARNPEFLLVQERLRAIGY